MADLERDPIREALERLAQEILALREKAAQYEIKLNGLVQDANKTVESVFNQAKPDCGRNPTSNWR